jgi:NAD(P)-dependent dehydrogenase (short-subunit alcohol dehydrogenase family)
MELGLNDKVAIVTGAADGIGRAIALCLASEGANVVVADINSPKANDVVDKIKASGGKAVAIKTDVTKSEATDRMIKDVLDMFGKIDILVNNAGGSARKKNSLFHESSEDIWDWVIGLNLKGTRNCCRSVVGHMMERRSGKIINMGSSIGMNGRMRVADYSAAKGGIIAFTKTLSKELGSYGIYVNCVSPGPIETSTVLQYTDEVKERIRKQVHLGRWGKPEEVADVVAFLASEKSSFITGQNIAVCGGLTLGY